MSIPVSTQAKSPTPASILDVERLLEIPAVSLDIAGLIPVNALTNVKTLHARRHSQGGRP